MSADQLAAIVGIVLSLVFSYVPGLSDRFATITPTQKRLVMGLLLIVVAGAVFGLSCSNLVASVTCDKQGALGLVNILIMALIANQSVYQLTKPAKIPKLMAGNFVIQ